MKRGLRRPWDGEDGKNYLVWLRERRGEAEDSESESDEDESFDSMGEWSDEDEDEDELDVPLNDGSAPLSPSESQTSPTAAAVGSDFSFGGFLQGRSGGARSPQQQQEEEHPELAGISDSDEESDEA